MDRIQYVLYWKIENFSLARHKMGEKLVSPVFPTKMLDNTSWTLELYPEGVEDESYIGGFLTRNTGISSLDCEVHYDLTVAPGGDLNDGGRGNRFTFKLGQTDGFPLLVKRKAIEMANKDLNVDFLTLRCRIYLQSVKNYNFVGKSFARTRLLADGTSYSILQK
ncbi:hypothetical protein NPIL_196581 [Nephila pilipes]|uniref:MATH domain-containing protein n=1 Tax=Nephila pilipes TaxID=299642 RepID=A0A8X6TLA9_NEPPI|nr:hypothetical protein NPIL_196581 [Nephila pilipes]